MPNTKAHRTRDVEAAAASAAPNGRGNGRPRTIYLDHSATTPLAPDVLEAMRPYLTDLFGNPSGSYGLGRKARSALEEARGRVAGHLGCRAAEVVFTSGGTESDNLAIHGVVWPARASGRGAHIVTTAVEHKAVLATCERLVGRGFELTTVPVDRSGRVGADAVLSAVRDDTVLVTVMLANNEVGTLQPVAEIGAALRGSPVTFHTDAVQAAAWLPLHVEELGVDLLSLSAHKLYGPKGVGALYVRSGVSVEPPYTGGGQEHSLRSGTENVAGAVGLAAALELAASDLEEAAARACVLRDHLIDGLLRLPDVELTGHRTRRLPGHVSVCVHGAPADTLLVGLDMRGVCASSGSACSSGKSAPSHVLTAMGIDPAVARGSLRLTLGRSTTADDVDYTLHVLTHLVMRTREMVTT